MPSKRVSEMTPEERERHRARKAANQAAHRERIQAELEGYRVNVQAFLDEFATACEAADCEWLVDNLPENTWEAVGELRRRLAGEGPKPACKLVVCRRERKDAEPEPAA